jgi:hypothetical protein
MREYPRSALQNHCKHIRSRFEGRTPPEARQLPPKTSERGTIEEECMTFGPMEILVTLVLFVLLAGVLFAIYSNGKRGADHRG